MQNKVFLKHKIYFYQKDFRYGFIDIVSNLNQRKAGVVLSYFNLVIGFIVALVFTPILLRLLGQSEYGLYNLVASVVAYLGVLNFGFGSAYVRYYSQLKVREDYQGISKLNGMFLIIFSVLGVIALISGLILTQFTDFIYKGKLTKQELDTAKTLMYILVVNLALSFPSIVFTSHIIANEKFVFQGATQVAKAIFNPFLVLPILLLGYGSIGYALVTSILNLLIETIYAIYCWRRLQMSFSFNNLDPILMKEMTIFSSYIFINTVVDQINWNVDKLLIGRYHGTIGVAIYGVASTLNTYYQQISTAISNVFVPSVHKIVASSDSNNNELTSLFTKIGRIQFIILWFISSGLILFGKPFITKWAGENYVDSFNVALFLTLPVTIPLIQNIGIEIQRAKNKHRFRSILYILMAIVNIIISIPLTKFHGPSGAAMGTMISIIIGNGLIMNFYYHYKVGLNMKYFWKEILKFVPALFIPTVFGIITNKFIVLEKTINLLLFIIIYAIVYVLNIWFLGLNTYEKDLINVPINKLKQKIKK